MASWMVHLQVADRLLDKLPHLFPTEYIMGNIAPDSGIPNPDGNGYTPDKAASHFKAPDQTGHCSVNPPLFCEKHLRPEQLSGYDIPARSFYLGYLSHLLTDILWSEQIYRPCVEKHAADRGVFGVTLTTFPQAPAGAFQQIVE